MSRTKQGSTLDRASNQAPVSTQTTQSRACAMYAICKQETLLRCSQCKRVNYCSRECQIQDRSRHRLFCQREFNKLKGPEEKKEVEEAKKVVEKVEVEENFELVCPISYEKIKEPVMTVLGNVYDKKFIDKWLTTNNKDPLTNEELPSKFLVALKAEEISSKEQLELRRKAMLAETSMWRYNSSGGGYKPRKNRPTRDVWNQQATHFGGFGPNHVNHSFYSSSASSASSASSSSSDLQQGSPQADTPPSHVSMYSLFDGQSALPSDYEPSVNPSLYSDLNHAFGLYLDHLLLPALSTPASSGLTGSTGRTGATYQTGASHVPGIAVIAPGVALAASVSPRPTRGRYYEAHYQNHP